MRNPPTGGFFVLDFPEIELCPSNEASSGFAGMRQAAYGLSG
jgi:hypothetical protein